MSDAAVEFLLDNLKQLVAYNAKLIDNMRSEVDGLIKDLPLLKAIIEVSTETGREDVVVKGLVSRIRGVTFEAEDVIDAYMVVATSQKHKKWLQKLFGGIDHASKLRDIAKNVQTIKEEVDKTNNYQMLREALQRRNPGAGRRRRERRRPDVEKDNVVGFDKATAMLIDRLTGKTEDLQVISIVGMGGLGKTTLANKVYNDPKVSHEFSTLAWIYVSPTYTKEKLFLSILKDVTGVTSDMSNVGEDELAEEIRRQLTWKYLIVVDDVWEKKDWDNIKKALPNHKNGSRILLTTRFKHVAVHADQHSPPYELDFLSHCQSWELLKKKVFDGGDCPQEDLKDVGIQIAVQCDGLPLAAVVIAGMLQNDISKDAWETVAKSVKAFLVRKEDDLMEVLALSYHHLPPHLKACFLYFGVFPRDYKIPSWILIRLWIAERFVQTSPNLCLEDMAEEYLKDLVARNLLLVEQRSFSGRIKTCRIHDMLRDLCLRKALAEDFLLEIKDGGSTPAVSTINRRLCIHSGVLEYIATNPSHPHARSFLSFAKDQVNLPRAHVGYIPVEFKMLRVYHIQPVSFPRFPSEIEQLVHLTYVAFSGDFTSIPAAVSNLWKLQTLIAETSSRTARTIDIKANIWKMLQLRHLHTNKPSQLHDPVAKKTEYHDSLQTLTTITPESCTEGVLGQTPCLKKLGIRGKLATLLEEKEGSLFDNLTTLKQLVTLKLLNDVFPEPPSENKLLRLPLPNNFPPNLKRLTLEDTFLEWEQMHVLGMLPKLEELKLKDNAFTGVWWHLVDGGFKKLKALQIWKTDLVYWEAKAEHFPSLRHIVLKNCWRLWEIPSNLGNLEILRTIKIHQTSRTAAESAWKIKQQQQESKVYNGLKVEIFPPDLGRGSSPAAAASAGKIEQQQQESKVYNGLKVEIFPPDLGRGSSPVRSGGSNTSIVVEKEEVVYFKEEVETLMGKLHDIGEGGRLEIISIVGAAGGGKTTLAREVYEHPWTKHNFEIRAWVDVSQDYGKTTMKRDLLIRILELPSQGKHEDSEDQLGEKIHKCLKGRRYLIVMDDIWGIEAWNDIQRSFPKECKGSKVLSTSRLLVQPDSMRCVPHYLAPLPKSCSWELLQKKVFGKKLCPPELVGIGEQIAEKCEGLPLAIVAIAGVLATEDKTLDVWEDVAKHLSSTIAKRQEGCMKILELSYNHLPLHLKECFLYIGAHPEDYEIPMRELIWLWIAEGFIQQSEGGKSLEAVAEDYLIGLIDRSLIMVARKRSIGTIKACRIHDLLRELCLKKAQEHNFFVQIYRDDSFSPSATTKHRRLFIGHQFFNILPPRLRAQNIQSLLYLSLPNSSNLSHEQNLSFFVENFKLLRVLHLISATCLGEIGIEDLIHLRYLALRLPKGILYRAPNSFHFLSNLETLNLQVSRKDKISLPREIVKMVKLRHLYTKGGIFEYHHDSDDEDKGNMLDRLQTLHRLCICERCVRFLERTPNLRKLGLRTDLDFEADDVIMLPNLELLKCLEKLYVHGLLQWDQFLCGLTLTQLTLTCTFLKWEELSTILQTMPSLVVLKLLTAACSGPIWNTSELEEGFPQLKYLRLEYLDIVEWIASADQFRRLEVLVLEGCRNLEGIPIDFANLYDLREIKVELSNGFAEGSAREIQEQQRNITGDDDCLNLVLRCNLH